jgi:EAL domain-containing protein (putative c-di-GMP-specific phosphodiesterase class I)
MAFQPIVNVVDNTIDSHEALVRGPNGEGAGWVLSQVTDENVYAFDQACRAKAIELAAAVGLEGRLNINFLPKAVYQPKACIRQTLEVAKRTGFQLDRLTFELVEHERITDANHMLEIIGEYRRLGFKVALDDFGTGYSSLARLAALRPDIIKLDREIIKDCDLHQTKLTIVSHIAALASDLGVKLVAEGVERFEEFEVLRDVGVRVMQGFYFSRPLFERAARREDINWPPPAADAQESGRDLAPDTIVIAHTADLPPAGYAERLQ